MIDGAGETRPEARRPNGPCRLGLIVLAGIGAHCAPRASTDPASPSAPAVAAPRARAASASVAAPSESDAPRPPAPPAPTTPAVLEGHLDHFFEALASLERGSLAEVRVLQYGDSHTAADLGVSVFRRALQTRFGDAGRGFVALGKPWKAYWQDGLHEGMSGPFTAVRPAADGDRDGAEASFGLLGAAIQAKGPDARAWTAVDAPFSHVEVAFWQQPRGGSFEVRVDDATISGVSTRSPREHAGFYGFDVADAPHTIEVRSADDGPVRIFGMTLGRVARVAGVASVAGVAGVASVAGAQRGVVVDTLGIDGAQIFTPLRTGDAPFEEQVAHRDPRLVILAYGTNEAVDPALTDPAYEGALNRMIERIARAAPDASCLLLGPPDLARMDEDGGAWRTVPRLLEIVAIQRRVAAASGCAFYDQLRAMGGAGAITAWAAEAAPRAASDRVHLKRSGYEELATSFAADVLRAYDAWSSRATDDRRPVGP